MGMFSSRTLDATTRRLRSSRTIPLRALSLLGGVVLLAALIGAARVAYLNQQLRRVGEVDFSQSVFGSWYYHDSENRLWLIQDPLASRLPTPVARWLTRNGILLWPDLLEMQLFTLVDPGPLEVVCRVGRPTVIHSTGNWITSRHIAAFSQSSRLAHLELGIDAEGNRPELDSLQRCPRLSCVTISDPRIDAHMLQSLKSVETLRQLVIRGSTLRPVSAEALCEVLSGNHANRTIKLVDCTLPQGVCHLLRNLPAEVALDIIAPEGLDDACVESLSGIAGWRRLALSRGTESRITDAGLQALRNHPALEELDVSRQRQLTRTSWTVLPTLPRLRRLIVSQTQLTDADLEILADCPALETLVLRETGVTAEGIQRLRLRCPRLTVEADPDI